MSMTDMSREAREIGRTIKRTHFADPGVVLLAEYVIQLSELVAELASQTSSATDPRLFDQS